MKASKKTTEYIILALLLVFSSALILANLGNIYLWGDEANTALLAKTVLAHGVPVVYDGRNWFTIQAGRDYGKDYIWKWNPWLQYYVLAPFLAVFGTSTIVARLPFALFGIATIILTYYFAAAFWRKRRAGILAAAILTVSVPFLLLARQCRYYTLDAFFSLLGLYAYLGILERRKHSGLIFVLSAMLLFHVQFVQCAVLLMTVIVHALLFHRKSVRSLLILSVIVTVVSIPWIIWFSSLGREIGGYGTLVVRLAVYMKSMTLQTFKYIFPPLMLVIPVVWFVLGLLKHKRRPVEAYVKQNLTLTLLFAALTIVCMSLTQAGTFFRYLVPLIPLACTIMALIVESAMRIHPSIGLAIVALLAWWWRMPDYLYEITHDYDGPTEAIVTYLNEHARPTDVVVSNHDDSALKFYTNLRVVSLTTGEDRAPALKANWVVFRRWSVDAEKYGTKYLQANLPWDKYAEVVLPCVDIIFENREDPALHKFRTVTDGPCVIILERIAD